MASQSADSNVELNPATGSATGAIQEEPVEDPTRIDPEQPAQEDQDDPSLEIHFIEEEDQLTREEAKTVAEQLLKSQILACIFSVPIMTLCVIVIVTNWNQTCEAYLHAWLIGVAAIQFFRFPSRMKFIQMLVNFIREVSEEAETTTTLTDMKRSIPYLSLSFLNMAAITWYCVGLVEVMRPSDCSDKSPDVYKLSLALVIIFLAFLVFSCACRCLYMCMVCLHNSQHPMHQNEIRLGFPDAGATTEVIVNIFSFQYSSVLGRVHPERDTTCAICLSDFTPQDEVARLPCGHLFHADEIRTWLRQRGTCPLCNDDVTVEKIQAQSAADQLVVELQDENVALTSAHEDCEEGSERAQMEVSAQAQECAPAEESTRTEVSVQAQEGTPAEESSRVEASAQIEASAQDGGRILSEDGEMREGIRELIVGVESVQGDDVGR